MSIEKEINQINEKIKEINDLLSSIANRKKEYSSFVINHQLNPMIDTIKYEQLKDLHKVKTIHEFYQIFKDTSVNIIHVYRYDTSHDDGTYKNVSYDFDEKLLNKHQSPDDFHDALVEINSNYLDNNQIIDLTEFRSLYENQKILLTLDLKDDEKCKKIKI